MATGEYWSWIVEGFIREQNELWKLTIPNDINALIVSFYKDDTRYFEKYDKKLFKLENENSTIRPIGSSVMQAHSYMIYPSLNGFKRGIHKWAVKFAKDNGLGQFSRRAIGVVTRIDDEWINKDVNNVWPHDDDAEPIGSFYDGTHLLMNKWVEDETIEMVLNLNLFFVTYYKYIDDYETQTIIKLKQDELQKGETYFFALCVDCDNRCCVFECVCPTIKE